MASKNKRKGNLSKLILYYKQLEGLRALAVMMVIIFHWSPAGHHFLFPIGSWGVELFFVLSGFLITKILLENRLKAEAVGESKLHVLKNFIARRSLRIFPLYYLALAVILIFDRTNISGLKDDLIYFVGYASNFFFFKEQNFNYPMAHFWSLAVEEQFYLVWPWFILFLPKRFLLTFLIVSVFIGIASRMLLSNILTYSQVGVDVLTPTCIDCFAVGGLFSYFVTVKHNLSTVYLFINKIGIASFVLVSVLLITKNNHFSAFMRTFDSLFCLALIVNAYKGITGFAGSVASSKVLIYLGKISYGLYIYHLLTPWLTVIFLNIISRFKSAVIQNITHGYYHSGFFIKFTLDLLILITVASCSWFFIEKPINRYKYLFSDKRVVASKKNLISTSVL